MSLKFTMELEAQWLLELQWKKYDISPYIVPRVILASNSCFITYILKEQVHHLKIIFFNDYSSTEALMLIHALNKHRERGFSCGKL